MKGLLTALLAVVFFSGCGLIVHGKRQDLKINTEPPGMTAIVAGKSCVTPCTLQVPRKCETLKIIKQDGTESNCELNRTFNFWSVIAGNIWNEIWPGLIVDLVSGGAYTIEDVDIKFPQPRSIQPTDNYHPPVIQ